MKEQQNAVDLELKIRISLTVIPDFSGDLTKSIKYQKDKPTAIIDENINFKNVKKI